MRILAHIYFYFALRFKLLSDSIYNYLLLEKETVKINNHKGIRGRLVIKNKGKILIGDNVQINNEPMYNPVGMPHPTILATLNTSASITIGNNVGLTGVSIVSASSVTIGNNVLIGGGAGIWDTDFHPIDYKMRLVSTTKGAKTAPVTIEKNVFIGARAIILKGVTIGQNAVVAAGCVVNKDVPANSTVYGNPMQIKMKTTQQ